MGNSNSNYERHEDDEQRQRMVIGKEFRLVLGQVALSKQAKPLLGNKQSRHRKLSSSSSTNSTVTSSSSSDQCYSSASLIQLEIPTSPFDSSELDTQTLIQYLSQHESYGKELSHLWRIPLPTTKCSLRTFPTVQIAAIYYDQPSASHEIHIEKVSVLHEDYLKELNGKNILSVYNSKSTSYLVYTKEVPLSNRQYQFVRSTTMSKTALENFEWLQPFVNYSTLGYRLCGILPSVNSSSENSFTIDWIFERSEPVRYDYCLMEYQLKSSSSLDNWISILNLMSTQEWKLVATFDYNQKKRNVEQRIFLLFFQRLQN